MSNYLKLVKQSAAEPSAQPTAPSDAGDQLPLGKEGSVAYVARSQGYASFSCRHAHKDIKEKKYNDFKNVSSVLYRTVQSGPEHKEHPRDLATFATELPSRDPFALLINARPNGVDNRRYVQAIIDAEFFLKEWGAKAESLCWSVSDLFGLDLVAPLARYDAMGLIWLLRGRRVLMLNEHTATIKTPNNGRLTFYRPGVSFPWKTGNS